MKNHIFIPGNVPSSKNSRITNRKTGRSFPSPLTVAYKEESKQWWQMYRGRFRELADPYSLPLLVGFLFVRKSSHKFDFVNPIQTVQDEMVHHGWLGDDNADVMVPMPLIESITGKCYITDENTPGVYIKVLRPDHLNEDIMFNTGIQLL